MSLSSLIQDIEEQPKVLYDHAALLAQVIETVRKLNLEDGYVFTGIATSYYALQGMEMWLRRKGLFKGQLINTADLLDYDYPLASDGRPLFVLSRSGESAEIVRLIRSVSPQRTVIAITENETSPLAKRANYVCRFQANEAAFTNTKSFMLSLACALGIGIGLGYEFPLETGAWIRQSAEALKTTLNQWPQAEKIAERIHGSSALLIEAQGHLTGIANQACLDFQEIRHPAIPVTGGNFRHGTIELTVRDDVAVLVLVPGDATADRKLDLIGELYAKNKPVAAVIPENCDLPGGIPVLRVPVMMEELQPFVYVLAMHMIYSCFAKFSGLDSVQPMLVDKVTRKE